MRNNPFVENLPLVSMLGVVSGILAVIYVLHAYYYRKVYEEDQKEAYKNGFFLGFSEKRQSIQNLTHKKMSQLITSAHRECKQAIEKWEQKQALGEKKRETSKTPASTIYDIFEYKKIKYCEDKVDSSMRVPCWVMRNDAGKRDEDKESESLMKDIIQAENDVKHMCGRELPIDVSFSDAFRAPISPQYPAILGPPQRFSSAFILPDTIAVFGFFLLGLFWFLKKTLNVGAGIEIYGFEQEPGGNAELKTLIRKAEEKKFEAKEGDTKACKISLNWTHQPVRWAGDPCNAIYDLEEIKKWINTKTRYPLDNSEGISKTLTRACDVEKALIKHLKKLLGKDRSQGKTSIFAEPKSDAELKKITSTNSDSKETLAELSTPHEPNWDQIVKVLRIH